MKTKLLQYALNAENKIVYIGDLDKRLFNGYKCGCFCPNPACRKPLSARQGEHNQHSFAHQKGDEDCGHAYESSIHLLAKELLTKKNCGIRLPGAEFHWEEIDDNKTIVQKEKRFKSTYKIPDEAQAELPIEGFIPDVFAYIEGKPIIIEIYVTHKVDEDKIEKIKNSKISAIEIDLHNEDRQIDEPLLKEILEDRADKRKDRKWIYNAELEAIQQKADLENLRVKEFDTKLKEESDRKTKELQSRLEKKRIEYQISSPTTKIRNEKTYNLQAEQDLLNEKYKKARLRAQEERNKANESETKAALEANDGKTLIMKLETITVNNNDKEVVMDSPCRDYYYNGHPIAYYMICKNACKYYALGKFKECDEEFPCSCPPEPINDTFFENLVYSKIQRQIEINPHYISDIWEKDYSALIRSVADDPYINKYLENEITEKDIEGIKLDIRARIKKDYPTIAKTDNKPDREPKESTPNLF